MRMLNLGSVRELAPLLLWGAALAAGCSLTAHQGRQVTLATLDWEPYIGEALPGHGYVYEIVAEAFRSAGYQVRIRFYPWARAVEEAETGKADGLFPEYYGEARKARFVFSSAFPGGPVGLMARKASRITFPADPRKDQAAALQGLRRYSFGVVRGYLNTRTFDEATFLAKDAAADDEQNLRKLQAARVDLIFIDKYVAQFLIRTRFPGYAGELEFLEPPLEVKPLYIAFSRKAPGYEQKLRDFNEGLARLEKAGTLKAILRKYGFQQTGPW